MGDDQATVHDRGAGDVTGRATIARLSTDVLPRLIERLTKSELGELEVREDGWRIRLRRPRRATNTAAAAPAHAEVRGARPVHGPAIHPVRGRITSPAVGYFTAHDGLAVGAELRQGDVIGHVDVLGVRVEVVSPADGVVGRVLAQAGEAVEYGQELLRIDLASGGDGAADALDALAPTEG